MRPLKPLLIAIIASAPLAAWAGPCDGFAKKGFKAPESDVYVYTNKEYIAVCKDIWDNAGYTHVPEKYRLQVVQQLADALHKERQKGGYKWFSSSVLIKTGDEAKKNWPAFIEGPSYKVATETTIPGEPVYTKKSSDLDLANFYADNEWEIAKDVQETITKTIAAAMATIRKPSVTSGLPGRIKSVSIFASCNRFPNNGKAKDLSFEQLADNRATTAAALLAKAMDPDETDAPTSDELHKQFVINVDGENFDGTSGPATPFDDPQACGYDPLPDEVLKAGEDAVAAKKYKTSSRVEQWAAIPDAQKSSLRKKYYDAAKYVKIHFEYEVVDAKPTEKILKSDSPVKILINLMESEKPSPPAKIKREKPGKLSDRGRTDCVNPNRRR